MRIYSLTEGGNRAPIFVLPEREITMSLREILIDELKDLYSAENQLMKALPKTAKACESDELKQVFLNHIEETKGHVERLKTIFEKLGKKATGKHCSGMEGAIEEVKEALDEDEEGALFDAGVLGAALRVEHYEIAGYTSAIAISRQLGETEIVGLLTQTLTEELNAGKSIQTVGKTILKAAYAMEPDEKNTPEKKPKDAKAKLSEEESKEDEKDAQKGLRSSAAQAMEDADDKDDEAAKAEENEEDSMKETKKAAASKAVAGKSSKKSAKKSSKK